MIRQAISCDICKAEKKQTNHWFVAYEISGELRVSGWTSRNRLRTGSKHLCGQVCLHKLADDFMARVIAGKATPAGRANAAQEEAEMQMAAGIAEEAAPFAPEASAAGVKTSPRLVAALQAAPLPAVPLQAAPVSAAPLPAAPQAVPRPPSDIAESRPRPRSDRPAPPLEEPLYATRHWRAAAWERERERTLRGADCRPEIVSRRISQA